MTQRIANLVGANGRGMGFGVPEWAVGPGFESEVVYVEPMVGTVNDLDWRLNDLVFAQAAIDAVDGGADAVIINTWADYGLPAMRAVLSVPVVGCGQAAMQVALGLGRRFGVVTIWPEAMRPLYDRILALYELDQRCVGVWFTTKSEEVMTLDAYGNVLKELHVGGGSLLERVETQGQAAIAAGADVIVLGCTCMSPLRDEVARRWSVPVVDPLVTGHKMAEMLLTLGISHGAPSTPSMAQELLRSLLRGSPVETVPYSPECDDACEVLSDTVA
jgi:allantoin racemase